SRTFRYGYLVTTSPQSSIPPSTASSPKGCPTGFGCYGLSWCDGRCVQDPGTYSPRHSDPRLLAIPASCSRVAESNPDRKSTRLNSSHVSISYAVFCLKKKK